MFGLRGGSVGVSQQSYNKSIINICQFFSWFANFATIYSMLPKEEIIHIAKLARLELTEQEIEKMQKDLSAILDYFHVLKKAKSDPNLRITSESTNVSSNATRKDLVVERPASLANNLVQAAPDKKDGYVKVKAIL